MSCTNRKRFPTAFGLSAHQLAGVDVIGRLRTWKGRLRATREEKYPAEHLYMGEHWSVVRSILSSAGLRGWEIRLWICSAGYGLIRSCTRINAYQVTFAPGAKDSVAGWGRGASQMWWAGICSYPIPKDEDAPRSFKQLALQYPRTPTVVALSADYLNAVEKDLLSMLNYSYFGRHLAIISCGTSRQHSIWHNNLLPCDGTMSASLGGTFTSLNARVARFLFDSPSISNPTVDYWTEVLSSLEKGSIVRSSRSPQSDAEITSFIQDALEQYPTASKSKLLESFRATGRACEQKRFGYLFMQIKQEEQLERYG